jgi:RNA polymerase sigma-70 factor (family 1)
MLKINRNAILALILVRYSRASNNQFKLSFSMTNWKTLTNEELIERLNFSDHAAFTEIFHRYHGALYSFAFKRCREREIAEELVQDLFVNIWLKRSELVIKTTLSGYLYVALRNLILNQVQKQMLREKVIESLRSEISLFQNAPEEILIAKEIGQALDRNLYLLPEKCRAVYELSRKQYKSNKQIATELGITEKTVENHMTRALRFLRLSLHHLFIIMNIYALLH